MEKNITDRLEFLAEQFDVFDVEVLEDKIEKLESDGYTTSPIHTHDGLVIAIVASKLNDKDRVIKKISISSDVFANMIVADPTDNKTCLQWMLTLFSRLLKDGSVSSIESAIRFVIEDLPQANNYLTIFEDNKRKKKFVNLCKVSHFLQGITDPSNINQYKSLSQLFDAIDPFITKEPSAVARTLDKFVELGEATIPIRDRKYTVYSPKSLNASTVFEQFSGWCTARAGNGMFLNYTKNYKKPNGDFSNLYIIINNDFFINKSDEIYQIHFESNQIKDRSNKHCDNLFENVLSKSENLLNYFHDELIYMAKDYVKRNTDGLTNNKYFDFLVKFGFSDNIFDIMDPSITSIHFKDREIPRLPNLDRFTDLEEFVMINNKLSEIHESIGKLKSLHMLILPKNNLRVIPKEIGLLKNLIFINLTHNHIIDFPDEIKYLDKENGGSLIRMVITREKIGHENYRKLKKLLPTTIIDCSEENT